MAKKKMVAAKGGNAKKQRKHLPKVRIPLSFNAAVSGLLQVKPEQKKNDGT
jgi:hypothetical protein